MNIDDLGEALREYFNQMDAQYGKEVLFELDVNELEEHTSIAVALKAFQIKQRELDEEYKVLKGRSDAWWGKLRLRHRLLEERKLEVCGSSLCRLVPKEGE